MASTAPFWATAAGGTGGEGAEGAGALARPVAQTSWRLSCGAPSASAFQNMSSPPRGYRPGWLWTPDEGVPKGSRRGGPRAWERRPLLVGPAEDAALGLQLLKEGLLGADGGQRCLRRLSVARRPSRRPSHGGERRLRQPNHSQHQGSLINFFPKLFAASAQSWDGIQPRNG